MTPVRIAITGSIATLATDARQALLMRRAMATGTGSDEVSRRTASIIARVRAEGDAALAAMAQELDGVVRPELEVPRHHLQTALATLDPALRGALEHAAANIRAVHAAFAPRAQRTRTADGVIIGRRPDPLPRVGVYAPGGRAAYPSSVLMGVIPARVAGVDEVVVCSPPGPDGLPSALVLAAVALAGADRVFAIGGAGAIAAMAVGTGTVPRVDRIVGPGNAYVAEAKRQLAGEVGIDSPAGPSELLILADGSASPAVIAAELLAQAEHDPDAMVVLVALDPRTLHEVGIELEATIGATPRRSIIREALAARGALLLARSLDEAIDLANDLAPEHLLLLAADPIAESALARLRGAGTVLMGDGSSVTFGDYLTGANHVLPTGGRARLHSGLSTLDFVRWTSWQRVDRRTAGRLADDTARLADAEGLPAHAAAARRWSTS